jgi:GT2 family glycosyltransferase
VVRRALLEEIGGFDTTLSSCQDWDMYLRLARRSNFGFIPEVLVRHYVGNGDRITHDGLAVVNGHMRLAEKYREQSRDFPPVRRARHLYALGQRLVGLGYKFGVSDAVRFGRGFVLAAYLLRPVNLRYLAYYLASYSRFTSVVLWRRTGTMLHGVAGAVPKRLPGAS